ncbi:MAG: SLATT domain-containing protein [Methylococcaceae bacterium]|nr:SLATT domain-containing protein [Methylococcaceae bacterium]
MSLTFKNSIFWLFSLYPIEQYEPDPVKKLMNSMRMTSRCRFNASSRINVISKYSFFTTTFLSLGIIFIPLIQNSDVPLHFISKVLNMMQIFLAVAILVYSVINGTARYDVRSLALNECGDKVKDLIRQLRDEQHKAQSSSNVLDLTKYHEDYKEALNESENHSRLDYLLSILEMPEDYKITGLKRAYYKLKACCLYIIPFILPTLMIIAEFVFILDLLGISHVMPSFLGGDPLLPCESK